MPCDTQDARGGNIPAALPLPPAASAGPSPSRRARSVRRTMSIEVDWPEGVRGPQRHQGRARDVLTIDPAVQPQVLAEDRLEAMLVDRAIVAVACDPPGDLAPLIGARAGGALRGALAEALAEERAGATPLYLLLDDLAGASLVANWVWSRWDAENPPQRTEAERIARFEGICIGFRPGSSAIGYGQMETPQGSVAVIGPLARDDDPAGWHALVEPAGANFRRARRIDAWIDGEAIRITAGFQDSGSLPEGGRVAVHEYRISASADRASGRLIDVAATPSVLPHRECPAAVENVAWLVGRPLTDLREDVPALLRRTAGCTHLNDALRALAEVPQLVRALPS